MKRGFLILIAAALSAEMSMTAFAGQWQKNETGWRWQEDDGNYPANTWMWIDGNNDGMAECYYFDGDGYLLVNGVSPDGCRVNGNGAWTENDVVKIRTAAASSEEETSRSKAAAEKWPGIFSCSDGQTVTVTGADTDHVYLTFRGYGEEGWYSRAYTLTYKNAERTIAGVPVYSYGGEVIGEDIYMLSDDGNSITVDSRSFKMGTYSR